MSDFFKSMMVVWMLAIVSACGHAMGGEIQEPVPGAVHADPPTNAEAENSGESDTSVENTEQRAHQEADDAEPPMNNDTPPPATQTQAPLSLPDALPDGYRFVEASDFAFAVPNEWHVEEGIFQDIFSFQLNGERVGETEILGWFDAETWKNFKPNHSEQTDFQLRDDLLAIPRQDVHLYKIQLIHTKPAAEQDPEWKYEETRWYVSVKENERAYGFYFPREKMEEKVMETILSTFRLK